LQETKSHKETDAETKRISNPIEQLQTGETASEARIGPKEIRVLKPIEFRDDEQVNHTANGLRTRMNPKF